MTADVFTRQRVLVRAHQRNFYRVLRSCQRETARQFAVCDSADDYRWMWAWMLSAAVADKARDDLRGTVGREN